MTLDPASGLPAALALRLGIVVATLLAVRRNDLARLVAFLGSATASVATGLTAVAVLRVGAPVHGVLLVHRASQFSLSYTVDGLSAWFLVVLSLLTIPIAIFSIGYIAQPHFSRRSVFLGVGVKAGIIPLHVWLPEAHPAAPTSISALTSGILIKTGIYGIIRVCAFGLGVPRLSWGVFVVALGAISALLGVLYALMQHD